VTLAKLRQIGYRVERVPPSLQSGPASLPATRLSASERRRLIEIEHGLWLRDRLLHGYAYAEHTIERLRLQRDLTTLEDLPPEDLQLDEALVDAALAALHGGGYRLAPVTEERTRVRVGVTGHRLLAETARVSAGLREALARIRSAYGNRPLTLLSMLAEGADRLAVEAALHTPDAEHVAMLPLAPEEYAHDFGPPGSPSRVHFAALLARSTAVLQVGAVDGREAGYARAGQELVNSLRRAAGSLGRRSSERRRRHSRKRGASAGPRQARSGRARRQPRRVDPGSDHAGGGAGRHCRRGFAGNLAVRRSTVAYHGASIESAAGCPATEVAGNPCQACLRRLPTSSVAGVIVREGGLRNCCPRLQSPGTWPRTCAGLAGCTI